MDVGVVSKYFLTFHIVASSASFTNSLQVFSLALLILPLSSLSLSFHIFPISSFFVLLYYPVHEWVHKRFSCLKAEFWICFPHALLMQWWRLFVECQSLYSFINTSTSEFSSIIRQWSLLPKLECSGWDRNVTAKWRTANLVKWWVDEFKVDVRVRDDLR